MTHTACCLMASCASCVQQLNTDPEHVQTCKDMQDCAHYIVHLHVFAYRGPCYAVALLAAGGVMFTTLCP